MTRVLRLTLEHNESGEVLARWQNNPGAETDPNAEKTRDSDGYAWPAYLVEYERVREAAAEIDHCLKALTELHWPDIFEPDSVRTKAPDYAACLRDLARAGQALRGALFSCQASDARGMRVARAFSAWFDERVEVAPAGEWRIEVVYLGYPKTHPKTVPWGLAFDLGPDQSLAEIDPRDPNSFSGFWCQRYGLAVRHSVGHAHQIDARREGKVVRMLVALERADGGRSQIEESAPSQGSSSKRAAMEDEYFAEDADSYKRKVRHVVGQKDDDSYLYMSLRSDARPEDPDTFKITDITKLVEQRPDQKLMLAVLDGDAVIRGDRGKIWLDKVAHLGQNGLIATEVDVVNPQLKFLGWQALTAILQSRKPIIDAMKVFRENTWPLGLIYGVYCNPIHVYIDPPPDDVLKYIGNLLKERRNASA